jgi:putative transposase
MGRSPRNTNPNYTRHISIRTEGAALFLLPDAQVNHIVGGVIAKYQELFSIVIFAYTVLGNHLHILAQAPQKNLWRFEQAVNREVAKRINRVRNRRGHFWERRYDEQMVAERSDIIEALIYVLLNAVNHGLVEHPALWPGLNCFQQLLDGKDRTFRFTNFTAYQKAKRKAVRSGNKVNIRDFQMGYTLRLSPIPQFEDITQEQRRAEIQKLVTENVVRIKRDRKAAGQGFLGREAVLRQKFSDLPRNVKRHPRPLCYTKSWEGKKNFMSWFFPWLESYRQASLRFRSGEFHVQFPEYCLMPPLHYSPLTA